MTPPGLGLALLLSRTWAIYRAHLGTILVVAGAVVAVVEVILGLGLGELTARYRATVPLRQQVVALAAVWFVATPLIGAMLARVVLDVIAGEEPSARRAIRTGLDLFAPVLIATVLWSAALAAGLLLVLPGLYIAVSWYFVVQAVVVDDRRGVAALTRSGELVRGRWLATTLVGLVFQAVVLAAGLVGGSVFDAAARAADATAVLVVGDIVVQTLVVPFLAIGATLYYLDLRADPSPRARPPAG